MAPLKTCLGCKHFSFISAEPGYSEFTPGGEADLLCAKAVWEINLYVEGTGSLYKKLTTAETCEHYEFDSERAK